MVKYKIFFQQISEGVHAAKQKLINNDQNIKIDQVVCKREWILSPSDVGIHNIIHSKFDYYFIDFEYSGWDDPAKYFIDWLIQPNYIFPGKIAEDFLGKLLDVLDSPHWLKRAYLLIDLYRYKWCLIILNKLPSLLSLQDPPKRELDQLLAQAHKYFINSGSAITIHKDMMRYHLCRLR